MTDRERLINWMQANEYRITSLAKATGDHVPTISYIVNGNREVSQAFVLRFLLAFGIDTAKSVFQDTLRDVNRDSNPTPQVTANM